MRAVSPLPGLDWADGDHRREPAPGRRESGQAAARARRDRVHRGGRRRRLADTIIAPAERSRPRRRGDPFAVSGVVVTEGGPPPPPGQSDVRPDSHQSLTISGTTDHGAHMTRFATTDARGRFALRLPPGTFTITARAFGGSIPADGQPHARVVIQPGHSLHVRITAHVN
jgi:hypothetical protein